MEKGFYYKKYVNKCVNLAYNRVRNKNGELAISQRLLKLIITIDLLNS